MNRNAIGLTLISLTLASGIVLGRDSNDSTIGLTAKSSASIAQEIELQSFTHVARIPADSDTGTIRFEKAKMVRVPTRIAYTINPSYCEGLAFRDPGGSAYCPYMQTGSPATAYEVTYSYVGKPLASDEYGGRNFTFQVYFRPDELAPEVRQALTEKKLNRADFAGYFKVDTFREPATRMVIDEAKSHFCDGNFVDGAWTHTDAGCNDEIQLKAAARLSDYITVRVDAGAAVVSRVSTKSGPTPSFARK
jgi:hypothetical protein